MIENALKIDGWMTEIELNWIAKFAKPCKKIIEVGSHKGRSTTAFLENSDAIVYAIDPWKGPYFQDNGNVDTYVDMNAWDEFCFNMNHFMIEGRLIPVIEKFNNVSFGRLPTDIDLIFLDGDHRYEFVKHDIIKSLTLVKKGGIISGHDFGENHWPSVKRVVEEVFPNNFQVEDHIWWTIV